MKYVIFMYEIRPWIAYLASLKYGFGFDPEIKINIRNTIISIIFVITVFLAAVRFDSQV